MPMFISDTTVCPLCGEVIRAEDPVESFPAFLPPWHYLANFSDAVFHRRCFDANASAMEVRKLYGRFSDVIAHRPRQLKTLAEAEQWQRQAIKELWDEYFCNGRSPSRRTCHGASFMCLQVRPPRTH